MLGIVQRWANIYNPYIPKVTTDKHYKGRKTAGGLQRKEGSGRSRASMKRITKQPSPTSIRVLPPLNLSSLLLRAFI